MSIIILSICIFILPSPLRFTLFYSICLLSYILTLIHLLTSPLLPLYQSTYFLLFFYNISNITILYHYTNHIPTYHPYSILSLSLYFYTTLCSKTHIQITKSSFIHYLYTLYLLFHIPLLFWNTPLLSRQYSYLREKQIKKRTCQFPFIYKHTFYIYLFNMPHLQHHIPTALSSPH